MSAQSCLYKNRQSNLQGLSRFFKKLLTPLFLVFMASSVYSADIDIDKLALKAKEQNKHIMFFHHIPGCPYCKAMLKENFQDEALLKQIDENFIYVDIYTATEGSIRLKDFQGNYKEFSGHVGAFAYPSTIFMNGDGEVIHKAVGYRNIDEHFAEISYVSTGSYKTMDLEAYVQKLELEQEW